MNNRTGNSKKPGVSRRRLLKLSLGASVGGVVALLAAPAVSAEEVASCADLDDIFANYESLNYSEISPIADKSCGSCAFFDQASKENCRYCEMMDAPVNITGHCDAWAIIED